MLKVSKFFFRSLLLREKYACCISIVIGWKVENKFLIKELLIKIVCTLKVHLNT